MKKFPRIDEGLPKLIQLGPDYYHPDIQGKLPAKGNACLCWTADLPTRIETLWIFPSDVSEHPSPLQRPDQEIQVLSILVGNLESLMFEMPLHIFAPRARDQMYLEIPTLMTGMRLTIKLKNLSAHIRHINVCLGRIVRE